MSLAIFDSIATIEKAGAVVLGVSLMAKPLIKSLSRSTTFRSHFL